jgi:fatty-acyl-CoA synthase
MRQMIAGMEITEAEIFVSWLPVYHDMGLILKTMVPFYLAASIILLPTSLKHVDHWLAAIQQYRATFTAAPDFAYRLCLRHIKNPRDYDLSSLRVALNAAEPVRAQTIRDFERTFGLKNVMVAGYGLAEATVGVSMGRPQTEVTVDEQGQVSVGRPFLEIEVAIVRDGQAVGPGEVGEIVVNSPANSTGYYNNAKATHQLFWRPGTIQTGDLGYLNADGELFIVGRKKNIIIHSGRTIYPQEVEEMVDGLPGVRYSAAVGIDRGRLEGEQVYIFAEIRQADARPEAELQNMIIDIVQMFHERFGFRPGRVYLLKPKAIPLTHNGKIQHVRLKEIYLNRTLFEAGEIVYPK